MLAVQSQDYAAALWATGLRSEGATQSDVEQAVARGDIIRTWPMRGTYHFIAAEDTRWLVGLLAPRAAAAQKGRRNRLEITEDDLGRAADVAARELSGRRRLTRPEFYRRLEAAGVATDGQRGIHIVLYLAQTGVLVYGPFVGNQPALMLFDDWVPPSRTLEPEEALAQLALRYFAGHGPAGVRDLAWWAGLALTDARKAIALAGDDLVEQSVDGMPHWIGRRASADPRPPLHAVLLPAFDEYLVGYADRSAVLAHSHLRSVNAGGGLLAPTVVVGGRVAGTWRLGRVKDGVAVIASLFGRLDRDDEQALDAAAARYGDFLGLPAALEIAS
jgi:hypothetical protein